MKFVTQKSYRIAREMGNFIQRLPGAFPFSPLVYPWLASEPSDTTNHNSAIAPDPVGIPPTPASLVDQVARLERELEELDRNHFYNDALYYKRQSELHAEQARIAKEASRPRFTADIEREIRRNNQSSPYSSNLRGPRPLGRSRRTVSQGSAMNFDTSFHREPSMMDVDGPSFSRPRPHPQPKRWTYTPAGPCPSIIMEDSSFVIRSRAAARKARGESSIRVEFVNIAPAVADQNARDKEEQDRIAAQHARRMNEEIEQRMAAEREKARLAAVAERQAEEARQAEAARIAEKARKASEAEELARKQAEQEAEALRAAEAERVRAVKAALCARLKQECDVIKAEPDAVLRAFKMYEWKMQLIKTQTKELVDADMKFSIAHLPWPFFEPHTPRDLLNRSGDEPVSAIGAFVFNEKRGVSGSPKKVVHKELLRWHPDKVDLSMLAVVRDDQRDECRRLITLVSGYLNTLAEANYN